jgi:hypothetical protein
MLKIIVAIAIFSACSVASAHEDRILPIRSDGTIGDLPATFGQVRVDIARSGRDSRVTSVQLSSPRFRVRLNPCVLRKLDHVVHVQASGSWYHNDLQRHPPYISLTFYTGQYDQHRFDNDSYAVTFSLIDGRLLSGMRTWDPWWGNWRGQYISPANKCSHWATLP